MPLEIERKFLLAAPPDWSHPILRGARLIEYEQIYLEIEGEAQTRIRRGTTETEVSYRLARLMRLSAGVREVEERELDRSEYERLRARRDPGRQVVVKHRRCFHWREQFFELDDILRPASRVCQILELQVDSLDRGFVLPDFLAIDREVTREPAYSNAAIALG
jgi:CYTH domain-containing protein